MATNRLSRHHHLWPCVREQRGHRAIRVAAAGDELLPLKGHPLPKVSVPSFPWRIPEAAPGAPWNHASMRRGSIRRASIASRCPPRASALELLRGRPLGWWAAATSACFAHTAATARSRSCTRSTRCARSSCPRRNCSSTSAGMETPLRAPYRQTSTWVFGPSITGSHGGSIASHLCEQHSGRSPYFSCAQPGRPGYRVFTPETHPDGPPLGLRTPCCTCLAPPPARRRARARSLLDAPGVQAVADAPHRSPRTDRPPGSTSHGGGTRPSRACAWSR